jgi:hypothetical protein
MCINILKFNIYIYIYYEIKALKTKLNSTNTPVKTKNKSSNKDYNQTAATSGDMQRTGNCPLAGSFLLNLACSFFFFFFYQKEPVFRSPTIISL